MAATWLEVAVRGNQPELIEAALESAGAVAVTLRDAGDEPLYEPGVGETPMWDSTEVVGLFPGTANADEIGALLAAALPDGTPQWRSRLLEDRDWVRAWLDDYRPMRFGRHLWVVPHDAPPPQDDAAVVLRLDPGLAFGTGTHPTTALCLEWLDAHRPADRTVLDYGCGSGILAVAAALLGASRVIAVDIDPQALTATRKNAAVNGVADRIEVDHPKERTGVIVDTLLANILAAPLIDLAPRLARQTSAGGRLVLAGLLDSQRDAVTAAYSPWFDVVPGPERDGWRLLEARRNRVAVDV